MDLMQPTTRPTDRAAVYLRVRCLLCICLVGCGGEGAQDQTTKRNATSAATKKHAEKTQLPKSITNSIGGELILIPAGEFMMGSRSQDADPRPDEMPQHRVRITMPFYIGKFEVTQGEYEKIFPGRKSFFRWPDGGGKDQVKGMNTARFPAELVKWVDAAEFCQRLSALPAEKKAGRVYRLPTEAEWEYACRAGTTTSFHYGNSLGWEQANFIGTAPFGDAKPGKFRNRTTRVGSFKPNAFGLYDMHGNVWEWCSDWYQRDYYSKSPLENPAGPKTGSRKIIRGGDWFSDGRDCRTAFRYAGLPRGTFYATGMRVVMTMDGKTTPSLAKVPDSSNVKAEIAATAKPDSADIGGEDWPRYRGPRGNGTWQGAKLPNHWPASGLKRVWRQPLGGGYGGVVVVAGQVYVMDRQRKPKDVERILCFDAATGKQLWKHEDPVDYKDIAYDSGPRSTPCVTAGRLFTVGATGVVHCLEAKTGKPIWGKDLVKDFRAAVPIWGFCSSPVPYKDLLIVHVGAPDNGCILALEQRTGKLVWKSLPDPGGYSTPLLVEHQQQPLLIAWTPNFVQGLRPDDGKALWSEPFKADTNMSIAMPIFHNGIVIVTAYYNGTMAVRLGKSPQQAKVLWEEKRNIRGHMAQPLHRQQHGYLLDRRHGVTCFELATGKKVWDAANQVTAKARNPHATMVWVGDEDRALILNSDGELILARLNPQGYREISRIKIIGETWAHPAYAGTRVYARSNTEIVCVSLVDGQ